MIVSHPAVQFNCKHARRIVFIRPEVAHDDKRRANRRHRRFLNAITREFVRDPEKFDNETFSAPSLTSWHLC